MFVTSTMAFGEHTQAQSKPHTITEIRRTSVLMDKILKIIGHFERKKVLSTMSDDEVIRLNNALYNIIVGRGSILAHERDLLLAISQVVDTRNIEIAPNTSRKIPQENTVSRYVIERGRIEYHNTGYTMISQFIPSPVRQSP